MGRLPKSPGHVTQFTFFPMGATQKKNAVAASHGVSGTAGNYGRRVEQVTTKVPGEPGTATAEHLADLASATPTMAN